MRGDAEHEGLLRQTKPVKSRKRVSCVTQDKRKTWQNRNVVYIHLNSKAARAIPTDEGEFSSQLCQGEPKSAHYCSPRPEPKRFSPRVHTDHFRDRYPTRSPVPRPGGPHPDLENDNSSQRGFGRASVTQGERASAAATIGPRIGVLSVRRGDLHVRSFPGKRILDLRGLRK
jgi:hypothetical protein